MKLKVDIFAASKNSASGQIDHYYFFWIRQAGLQLSVEQVNVTKFDRPTALVDAIREWRLKG